MPKIVETEKYLNTEEAMSELGASRTRFYHNAKPFLRAYRFEAKRTPWYKERDIRALKTGHPVRKASIPLSGILGDWTAYARSLGFQAETELCSVEVVTLPQDVVETFHLPADMQFVKRSRLTRIDGLPICTWSTFYPLHLVDDILDQMKHGLADHIVEHINEKHGVVIGKARDRYTARMTTFDEQALFHTATDEPALILQRVSYTHDKKTLVLYSSMVLLGSWFTVDLEYDVDVWNK